MGAVLGGGEVCVTSSDSQLIVVAISAVWLALPTSAVCGLPRLQQPHDGLPPTPSGPFGRSDLCRGKARDDRPAQPKRLIGRGWPKLGAA